MKPRFLNSKHEFEGMARGQFDISKPPLERTVSPQPSGRPKGIYMDWPVSGLLKQGLHVPKNRFRF